jgi:Tol biopolymer transport system component
MMNRRNVLTGILLLALTASGAPSPNAYELFQQALRRERTDGNCQKAVAMYEAVAREAGQNRELAASALIRAGACHETLGHEAARKSYQRVISDFADQKEQVGIARSRLEALTPPNQDVAKELLVRQVWAEDGVSDTTGAPSPDGRYVSYVHWKTANLGVRDLKTGTSRDVTDEGTWVTPDQFAYYSVWAPDGQSIAYTWVKVRINDAGAVVNEPELRVVAAAGGKPKTVFRDPSVRWIQPRAVTSDARAVVSTIRRTDGSNQLITISLQDGSLRVIKSLEGQDAITVSLSRDDRWIVYDRPERQGGVERDVMMVAFDGSSEIKAVSNPANDYGAVWTPKGDGFVFASDRGGPVGLWFQKVVNGRPEGTPALVKPDMGRMVPLGFTRNGTLFYGYASFENAGDVFAATVDFDTGKVEKAGERILHRFVGSNTSAAYSPDGKQLAYLSRRGNVPYGPGSWVVVVQELESGEERTLGVPGLEQVNNPRRAPLQWSPDGSSLIVTGRDLKGVRGLFRVDLQNGAATSIGGGSWPQWSPDGKSVYVSGFNRVLRRDVMSGESAVIIDDPTQQASITFALSPDGSQIAYRWISGPWSGTTPSVDRKQESGIRLVSLTDGETRELVRFQRQDKECPDTMVDWRTGMAFSADGRHVIFGRGAGDSDSDTIELWQANVESGEARRILPATKMIRDIGIHPDGKRISYTVNPSFQAEVWVLENLSAALKASR